MTRETAEKIARQWKDRTGYFMLTDYEVANLVFLAAEEQMKEDADSNEALRGVLKTLNRHLAWNDIEEVWFLSMQANPGVLIDKALGKYR